MNYLYTNARVRTMGCESNESRVCNRNNKHRVRENQAVLNNYYKENRVGSDGN